MTLTVHMLGSGDATVLEHVAPGVFDHSVDPRWCAEFFADPRHHLAVALDDALVVGMASAVHYVHPDTPPQLFINEVGVAPSHHRRGLGRRLLQALLERGRELECSEAWVLTDEANTAARELYAGGGADAVPEPTLMYTFRFAPPDSL